MFVAMGLSAVVPVLHGIQMFGVEQLDRQMGLFWVVTQGFLYILGAGIYASALPCVGGDGCWCTFGRLVEGV
jgi:adiponectin receptor